MKAYKKWYDEKIKPYLPISKHGPGTGIAEVFQEAREETWRAALEEVLKRLNDIYNGDFENSEIVKWIEEELSGD